MAAVLFLLSNERCAGAAHADQRHAEVADCVRRDGGRVEAGRAGRRLTTRAAGYPYAKLSEVPPGEYTVQAVLNVYETFHRADGTTVKLARGPGRRAALEPGAGQSVQRAEEGCTIGPGCGRRLPLSLDKVIRAHSHRRKDTEWVRHLTDPERAADASSGGGPCFLSAIVLLPQGWAQHPEARLSGNGLRGPLSSRAADDFPHNTTGRRI